MNDLEIIKKLKADGIEIATYEESKKKNISYYQIRNNHIEDLHLSITENQLDSSLIETILLFPKLKSLSLGGNELTKIDNNLSKLINLETLYLDHNNFSEIPECIFELIKLEELHLGSNPIKIIPNNISKLINLNQLYIDVTFVEEIPLCISKLTNLELLGMSGNKIEKIPKHIAQLKNLETLYLHYNKIKEIPKYLTKLKKLTTLSLNNNDIFLIPEYILDIEDLDDLDLSYNNIKKIPEYKKPTNSFSLDLSHNKIEKIPTSITKLKYLWRLNISHNPITKNLFKEIEKFESRPNRLMSFLSSIQNGETKQLNEAKILVLGDERVGKTSLINRIINQNFEITQTSTQGIDILNHHLSNDIKVNIWDFAGQEITHQTHQFFLSTRSLYLLVLDAQKEDNDSAIYDWLEVIKSNGGDSPVLVVINQIDKNRGYYFDSNRYKQDFPNIIDVIYTSAKEDTNIDQLIETIESNIEEIEGVRAVFNKDWFEVKETLENLSEDTDYIEIGEFDKICESNGIEQELDQQTLLSILHQIGTVVRYENRSLDSVQILNPLWVTNAVYKVIRSEFLNESAIFKRKYLDEIFKDDNQYKQRHHQWIMDLLVQFEVAFRVNENEVLIPSRLHNNQPDFDLEKFSGLNLRYSYEGRLKKSVISQFMVKMSRYLTNELVPYWKNGVFLERSNSKALVISNIDKREMYVYIDTENNQGREFLAIIRDKFDEINVNNIVIEEIPLIIDGKIVGYEEYEYLVGLEQDGETTVTLKTDTKKRRERFEISRLLNGYTKNDKKTFDYDKLRDDLIKIALSETKSRNSIYKESEDETNDRFEKALFNRNYSVVDQSRGGESSSGINAGERDLVIRNERGLDESVIEAFILKSLDSTVINKHYEKLVKRYDTSGNRVNFVLVYSKTKKFDELWKKYIDFDEFDNFVDTEDEYSQKDNVRVGVSEYKKMKVYHLFINFYSYDNLTTTN